MIFAFDVSGGLGIHGGWLEACLPISLLLTRESDIEYLKRGRRASDFCLSGPKWPRVAYHCFRLLLLLAPDFLYNCTNMSSTIPYVTPKLEILLCGHHHKLENLQEAMSANILQINLIQRETLFWSKVSSTRMRLKELIFSYTVALKVLNELCFTRKCLEKALRANSNVRKTQCRFNWIEERLGKILQRRDRAGARVRRGDRLFRSTNDRCIPRIDSALTGNIDTSTVKSDVCNVLEDEISSALSHNADTCFKHLHDDDLGFINDKEVQFSHSKDSKLNFHKRNSNCSSEININGNSIFDSVKPGSLMSQMAISSGSSHKSSKTSYQNSHYNSNCGSRIIPSNEQYTLDVDEILCSKFVPGYKTPYICNSADSNSLDQDENDELDGALQASMFQKEVIRLSPNLIPVMQVSEGNNSFKFHQEPIVQIISEIQPSNLPFIYKKKRDAVYLHYLECWCLFFKAQKYTSNFTSNNYTSGINTNYPQYLNIPTKELFNIKRFSSVSEGSIGQGIEQVTFVPPLSIDKNLSNEIDSINLPHVTAEHKQMVLQNSLHKISSFNSNNPRIHTSNDFQDEGRKINYLRNLFTSNDDVIIRYKVMKFSIYLQEVFDDILIFSQQIFKIANWRLHSDLLRYYRIYLPKFADISSYLICDFRSHLDKFSSEEHHELVVESSLLLMFYFPSDKNELFLISALLENRFKLYWIIISTFCIKYTKPRQCVIYTILTRLRTDTHEQNRLQLAKLIGFIKDWDIELYYHCYNVLSKLLWEDPSRNVREEIGKTMIKIGMSKEIIEENLYGLEHDDKLLRLRAVKSLGSLHVTNSKCIRKLLEILEIDSSMTVKLEVIKTLSILSIQESKIISVIIDKSKGEGYVALEAQKVLKILQSNSSHVLCGLY